MQVHVCKHGVWVLVGWNSCALTPETVDLLTRRPSQNCALCILGLPKIGVLLQVEDTQTVIRWRIHKAKVDRDYLKHLHLAINFSLAPALPEASHYSLKWATDYEP